MTGSITEEINNLENTVVINLRENNIVNIPQITNLDNCELNLWYNKLNFSDFENLNMDNVDYSNIYYNRQQAAILTSNCFSYEQDDNIELDVNQMVEAPFTHLNNVYMLVNFSSIIVSSSQTSSVVFIQNADLETGNIYYFRIANSEFGEMETEPFTISVFSTGISGIESPEKIILFPNPADQNITIQRSESLSGIDKIEIIDVYGRIVERRKPYTSSNKIEINVSNLVSGVYFAVIYSNDEKKALRFIVK